MRRVLVTGARGFLGSHCLEELARRADEVHAVSSRPAPSGSRPRAAVWHQADLLDSAAAVELIEDVRPSHLLHLAWFSGHREIYSSPENDRWVPASMTLVRAFHAAGGERALLSGSCAEYDWSDGVCSERSTPLRPATAYGAAKVALFRAYDELLERSGLSGAWGRIFFVYGPCEPEGRLLASVIRSLLAGEPAPCSHGEQRRDYLYVGDVADALVTLLASEATGAVNIGSGEAPPIKDLVLAAARRIGREELVRFGALPSPADEAPLVQAEVGRLVGEVGWHARYGLERGLERTIEYWRARGGAERP